MKTLYIGMTIVSIVIAGLAIPVHAEVATLEEAQTVANAWIELKTEHGDGWGDSRMASLGEVVELRRGDRILGYFCDVKPEGFIVVPLLKELGAVKAYSETCSFDPASDEGMADVIKGGLDRMMQEIEDRIGPVEMVQAGDFDTILEINYLQSWEQLESGEIARDYVEGEFLLSSSWHQRPPFNEQCPPNTCTNPPCYSNQRSVVGCVATAGAQILRYWNWPPYGEGSWWSDTHDWPNMPDFFIGCAWPQAEINAVAELCHEVGIAVSMNYGCLSGAPTADMEYVYQDNYRYSTNCSRVNRNDCTALDWFDRMKSQFNRNRPVHYRVTDHSLVGDGWEEVGILPDRYYHMNYGHDDSKNTWYLLDNLIWGGIDEEFMLKDIYPEQSLGDYIWNTYPAELFNYRYCDQDVWGTSAVFESGQNLQFLPGVRLVGYGTAGDVVRINSSTSDHTRLFTRGDLTLGVHMSGNGAIELGNGGTIKIE
jgi:hypothetical protein